LLKVLVVDQEPDTEYSLKDLFEKKEYEVRAARNVDDASGLLKRGAYDLVLADMMMNGLADCETFFEQLNLVCANTQVVFTGIPELGYPLRPIKEKICKRISGPAVMHCFVSRTNRIMFLSTLLNFHSYMVHCGGTVFTKEVTPENIREIALQMALLEVHDSYSASHQRRVGNLAADIAFALGMDLARVGLIRFSGYVHDIGKIKVPGCYLNKQGFLSAKERRSVQKHPRLGREMLTSLNVRPHIAQVAGQHHERIDGSGYPDGITGKDIHDESLIIMVADVVDAMLSDRPYRPAHTVATVMLELKKNSGILYDADIVGACCRLFEQETYIYKNIYI
jgi:putative nucleotidyltransferase with HDIG domain